jgi:NAD(P)-dependent dehydrogenase (short-subunit alcohol dehydrogenase family)
MSDLRDRVVVITGASSGTGAAVARKLHAQGARIIVVGRDRTRTSRIAAELEAPALTTDYLDLAGVRKLAEHIIDLAPTVDVLFSNAGGAITSTAPTRDGNEPNYQTNALAPFLLESLLLPALANSRRPRVVATSSRSHRGARLTPGEAGRQLDDPDGLNAHERYARAKLAGLLLHEGLRHRHAFLEVVDVHPGLVATDFGRYLGRTGAVLKAVARPLLSSPETAADLLIRLATRDLHSVSYFHRRHPREPSELVTDARLQREVWDDACTRLALPGDR